jgi:hypothetical protein
VESVCGRTNAGIGFEVRTEIEEIELSSRHQQLSTPRTNSNDPRTKEFALRMASFTGEGQKFRNFDVLKVVEF